MKLEHAIKIRDLVEAMRRDQEMFNEIRRQSENGRVDFVLYSPEKNIHLYGDNANAVRKFTLNLLKESIARKKQLLSELLNNILFELVTRHKIYAM